MSVVMSGDEDQASGNDAAAPSGDGRGSDNDHHNEDNRSEDAEHRAGGRGDVDNQESEDSSSDSDDDTSDDGGSASEAAQHLEEVYSHILKALHKTARIMCTGYERVTSDVQDIVQRAVQEVIWPNKTFIRSTAAHLSQWGQAIHNMLNSEGASTEERDRANREAWLAGLKCVRALLAEGEVFNEAEEQNTDEKLHDTIQSALRAANNQADKTLIKITKRVPGIVRKYVPNDQVGTFITSVYQSIGQHYLSVHGMVMSQVVVPFHIARGMYNTSGNMCRAVNFMIPGLSAAAANYRAAPPALPAGPGPDSSSQMQISEAPWEVPLQDTPTSRPGKEGHSEMITPHKNTSSKRSSSKAPLMTQSLCDFKLKESKIQTGGTPGSKRSSGKKEAKLNSEEIAKTWKAFERDDARDAACRVLEMNPTTSDKALSLSDHEDNDIEVLMARDAPSQAGTSGHTNRKRKGEKDETSSDEDESRPAGSSRRKKRKTHLVNELDMFDSDFKGKLSFSKKSAPKLISADRSTGANPSKTSKWPDDNSGLGSSLSEPKKSKDKDKKSRKTRSTGGPDPLAEELRLKREQQEKTDRDNHATQSLLVKYQPVQYALEEETMKNYRSQHIAPGRAKCENTDDHSGYITFVLHHNKQSYVCQSFHLFTVEAYFRRLTYKAEQAERQGDTKEQAHYIEVYRTSETTLSKKLTGVKGKKSDDSLPKYMIRVLWSSSGEVLDTSHLEYGTEQNLGLHGLVNSAATARITRKEMVHLVDRWGECYIDHGFCPLCSYSSGGHRALSNHIRAHLRLAMFCGWCYYASTSTDDMLRHGKAHEIKRRPPLQPEKK